MYDIQYYNRNSRLARMPEVVTGGVLRKNMFLKISQNSQEYICARVSFLIFTEKLRKPAPEMRILQNLSERNRLSLF